MENQTQITPSATLNDNLSTKNASSLWDKATVSTTEYNETTIVSQVISSKSFSKPIDLESSTTFGDSSQQLTPVFISTANSADVVKPTTRALTSSNDLSYSYVDNLSTKNFDSFSTALKTASDEITSSFTTPLQTSTDVINDTPTEIFTASSETASVSSATRTASVIQTDTFGLSPYSTYFPSVSLETSIKSASLQFQTSFTAAKPKQTISPTQSSGISSVYPTGTMTIDINENNSSVVSYDVPNSTITTNTPTPTITLTTIITTTELTSSRSTSSTQPSTKSTINTTNPATTTTKPAITKTKSTSPTTKQNTLKPSTPTPTPTPTTVKYAPSRKPTLTSTMTKTTVRINTTQPTRSNGSNVKASKLKDLESEVQQLKVGVGVLSASLILLLAAIIIYCIVKRRRKLVKFRRDYGIDDPIMERKPVKLNRESLNWDRVAISNRLAISDGSTEKDRFPMATFAISKGLNSVTELDDVFKDTRMSTGSFDDDVEEADHKSTNSYEIVTNGRTASDNEI